MDKVRIGCGLVWLALAAGVWAAEPELAEPWSPHALVEATVIDAETGKPITGYRVLAATNYTSYSGWGWQPHTIFEPESHVMRWPRGDKRGYDEQALRVEAEGYAPYISVPIARFDARHPREDALFVVAGKPIRLEFRLQPNAGMRGTVLSPAGDPASEAQLAIAMRRREMRIRDHRLWWSEPRSDSPRDLWEEPISTTSDEEGRFILPPETARAELMVAHPSGFKAIGVEDFPEDGVIRLEPWVTIKGRAMIGGEPTVGKVELRARTRLPSDLVEMRLKVETDKNGYFTASGLPPGNLGVCQLYHGKIGELLNPQNIGEGIPRDRVVDWPGPPRQYTTIEPGAENEIVLGGAGRPVIGQLVGPVDANHVWVKCRIDYPHWRHGNTMLYDRFVRSLGGRAYGWRSVRVEPDGSFRIDKVPPERYDLRVVFRDFAGREERIGYRSFQIETMPGGESDEPLDLGEIQIREPKNEPKPVDIL